MMLAPPLEATALGHRFGRKWGLRDCTFTVPAGRVVALVGPNGAGKTTLLRLACGLLRPTAGRVAVFGNAPRTAPGWVLPRIGFMPQDTPLYHSFTAADTMAFGRHLNPRFDAAVATARLRDLDIPLDRRVGALSSGQRAQVALTMVLAKRPELLLLDEPTADLDPLARRELLQGLLEAVVADGVTVVLSSHVLAELERCCDYLVLLAGGRSLLAGDIEEVRAAHKLLVGPAGHASRMAGSAQVITMRRSARQTVLLTRTDGAPPGPGWDVRDVGLEELVLAYLERARNPEGTATPTATVASSSTTTEVGA